jgi:adenylosuccinate lyase
VLAEFGAFPAVIESEIERYLPFLATTKILMASVKAGVGREVAHEAIKESAIAAALDLREGKKNNLLDALAADERIPFTRTEIDALIGSPIEFTGGAREQVAQVIASVEAITKKYSAAANYKPGSIR